jgi:hypothetical protein
MATWVIDWSKVTTVEHVKQILICADCRPNPNHHSFFVIQDLCVQIDDDGKRIADVQAERKGP